MHSNFSNLNLQKIIAKTRFAMFDKKPNVATTAQSLILVIQQQQTCAEMMTNSKSVFELSKKHIHKKSSSINPGKSQNDEKISNC